MSLVGEEHTLTVTVPAANTQATATATVARLNYTPGKTHELTDRPLEDSLAARQVLAAFAALETDLGGQVGLYCRDTGSGRELTWRGDQRFPMNSTFKAVLAAAVLAEYGRDGQMEEVIPYGAGDLVTYSPVTQEHAGAGMTRAGLCQAALQHSDNTAANLLMRDLGGPAAVTAYAQGLGDETFRLDRWETDLNDNAPGDPRDTTTPQAMGRTLEKLLLGEALSVQQREQLVSWMVGNLTGDARIRAGVPADWTVADKTGSGDYGTANDIAVIWPPEGAPLVLAVYTNKAEAGASGSSEAVAEATRIALAFMR
ncbi:class A beta-lactamase [Ruficoccus amylovorans]|uniref:class A beta-lactamase n=1 Tax=Ruficoccus amylovorans TaxID=1804625 RepID=UPI001FE44D5F|nr:class A beta-lactamase [Ruficoccus amylovorans]